MNELQGAMREEKQRGRVDAALRAVPAPVTSLLGMCGCPCHREPSTT
jgi:hypothetical protein